MLGELFNTTLEFIPASLQPEIHALTSVPVGVPGHVGAFN